MEDKLEIISKKLSILIALIIRASPESVDTKNSIKLLDSYGLSNVEVSAILGMKSNAVSMARARMNGGKNGKTKE